MITENEEQINSLEVIIATTVLETLTTDVIDLEDRNVRSCTPLE